MRRTKRKPSARVAKIASEGVILIGGMRGWLSDGRWCVKIKHLTPALMRRAQKAPRGSVDAAVPARMLELAAAGAQRLELISYVEEGSGDGTTVGVLLGYADRVAQAETLETRFACAHILVDAWIYDYFTAHGFTFAKGPHGGEFWICLEKDGRPVGIVGARIPDGYRKADDLLREEVYAMIEREHGS